MVILATEPPWMDLHCPLAPQVRQTIQFPLPAPELAGAGRFLVPYTTKNLTSPEPAAQGENFGYHISHP